MKDDIISGAPQNTSAQAPEGQDPAEAESPSEERVFDITPDLNIAPAVDRPVRTFEPKTSPVTPIPPRPAPTAPIATGNQAPRTIVPPINLPTGDVAIPPPLSVPTLDAMGDLTSSAPNPAPAAQPNPIKPAVAPIPSSQPRQPINIPLSDFTTSLQKAAAAPNRPSNVINTGKTNPLTGPLSAPLPGQTPTASANNRKQR